MGIRKTLGALLLGATILIPAAYAQQRFTADQLQPRGAPASRIVKQDAAGKPYLMAFNQGTALDTAVDTTAQTERQIRETPTPRKKTISDTLPREKSRLSIEDCVTCPPDLGPLMPAKVYSEKITGTTGTTIMRLEEACERIAGTYTDCLFPDESLVINQPLLKRQHKLVDAGKAKFEYFVNWDKSLTKEQNRANKEIWKDGRATYDELAFHSDVLLKNAEGKPYSAATVVPRLSSPGVEDCSYAIKVRADLCEMAPPAVEVPPPVIETPPVVQVPPVVETPPPVVEIPPAAPPITIIPPMEEKNPWYARAVTGTTGLASSLDWNKPANEYCPSDLCRGAFADHVLEGKTMELEVGYKQPDFTAALSGQKTEMDVERLEVSHGSLRKFFESTGVEARDITLKARGAFMDTAVQPYIAGEITKGDITLKDANTSRTDDMDAYQGTLGIKAGDFTKTFGYLGAGYRVFDQPHLLSAPTFNASVPATIEIKTPVAEAGGQVSLFNNRWDVFGDALYMFNSEAGDVKLENRMNYTVGTNIWLKNTGSWNLGLTGDYSNHDPMKLDLPGNPPALQNLVPDDTIRGGITIRW